MGSFKSNLKRFFIQTRTKFNIFSFDFIQSFDIGYIPSENLSPGRGHNPNNLYDPRRTSPTFFEL